MKNKIEINYHSLESSISIHFKKLERSNKIEEIQSLLSQFSSLSTQLKSQSSQEEVDDIFQSFSSSSLIFQEFSSIPNSHLKRR